MFNPKHYQEYFLVLELQIKFTIEFKGIGFPGKMFHICYIVHKLYIPTKTTTQSL